MPLKSQLHVDQLLSNISVKYRNNEYIADRMFPMVPVVKDSDLYRVYDRNFRIPETQRSDKAEAREHHFDVSTASYLLKKHALKDHVGDDEADNYDIADLRSDTTEELTDKILMRREKTALDLLTTTNFSLSVTLAAANAWNANTTVSNPIPVVHTGTSTVLTNTGFKPNYFVFNREALTAVNNHVSVLDRIKYTSANVTKDMIAALFEVDEMLISEAQVDSSALGATASLGAMLGDVAFLGWKPARPSPKAPSTAYIFNKAKPLVKRWRVEERSAEAIEVNQAYDIKVVASLTGYLIKDII